MGKSLPVINAPQREGLDSRVTGFTSPGAGPGDGRTVDDFKPYLVALNLTKRCNLKCDHCYLDATTKAGGGLGRAVDRGMLPADRPDRRGQ